MVNPKYIEDLNTIGVNIDANPRLLKLIKPLKQLDTAQLKKNI